MRRRILHAIHDFLPRHRAGSEIYAFGLARELSRRNDVFIVAAEYDPSVPHGTLRWRVHEGLTVIELANNWEFDRFEDSYSSARLNQQLRHVLAATCPDVLHVHNLLNLSFDFPRLARETGARCVATLHDYTLVCASGGQRIHAAASHVCHDIDVARCSRCFAQSPFAARMAAGRITRFGGMARPASRVSRGLKQLALNTVGAIGHSEITPGDMSLRLAYARHVFDTVDLFVAPSKALADAFVRFGLDRERITVSDYGFAIPDRKDRAAHSGPLRIGFVGTLVWHKGVHVLLQAMRMLTGNCEALIFGDPDVFPQYSAELRRLATDLPVAFKGAFDDRHIDDVYSSIDVLVVPSVWPENSPLVIHEAFMRGVAVIGAAQGGIPDLVTHGVNGFLYDSQSASELAAVLQPIVDDPALAVQLAAHAPHVKSLADDARDWETRYDAVLHSTCTSARVAG